MDILEYQSAGPGRFTSIIPITGGFRISHAAQIASSGRRVAFVFGGLFALATVFFGAIWINELVYPTYDMPRGFAGVLFVVFVLPCLLTSAVLLFPAIYYLSHRCHGILEMTPAGVTFGRIGVSGAHEHHWTSDQIKGVTVMRGIEWRMQKEVAELRMVLDGRRRAWRLIAGTEVINAIESAMADLPYALE